MRRDRLEIAHDVLKVISRGAHTVTRICYQTNLSWVAMRDIMERLVQSGFLEEQRVDGTRRFVLTANGTAWLQLLDRVTEMAPRFVTPVDKDLVLA